MSLGPKGNLKSIAIFIIWFILYEPLWDWYPYVKKRISSSILNILLGEIIGFIMTCDVNSEKRIIKIIPFNNMLKINNSSFMVSLRND